MFNWLQGKFGRGAGALQRRAPPPGTPPIMPTGAPVPPPAYGMPGMTSPQSMPQRAPPPQGSPGFDWSMFLAAAGDGARALQGMPAGEFAQGLMDRRMMMDERAYRQGRRGIEDQREDVRYGRETEEYQRSRDADTQARQAAEQIAAQTGDPALIAAVRGAPSGLVALEIANGRTESQYQRRSKIEDFRDTAGIEYGFGEKAADAAGARALQQQQKLLALQQQADQAAALWQAGQPQAQAQLRMLNAQIRALEAEIYNTQARTAAIGRSGGGPSRDVGPQWSDLPQ